MMGSKRHNMVMKSDENHNDDCECYLCVSGSVGLFLITYLNEIKIGQVSAKELYSKGSICNPTSMETDTDTLAGDVWESMDRVIHPAKGILYRIKNWLFNLLWPKDVYGIDRDAIPIQIDNNIPGGTAYLFDRTAKGDILSAVKIKDLEKDE